MNAPHQIIPFYSECGPEPLSPTVLSVASLLPPRGVHSWDHVFVEQPAKRSVRAVAKRSLAPAPLPPRAAPSALSVVSPAHPPNLPFWRGHDVALLLSHLQRSVIAWISDFASAVFFGGTSDSKTGKGLRMRQLNRSDEWDQGSPYSRRTERVSCLLLAVPCQFQSCGPKASGPFVGGGAWEGREALGARVAGQRQL